VRVRYAPSPTGFLHLGGLRTALYNYLFARASGGTFLLRIEDTDKSRQVPGSVEGLVRALHWCGLPYDEGPPLPPSALLHEGATAGGHDALALLLPQIGGGRASPVHDCGPYVQSQRLPLYAAAAARLVEGGHAYRCFCSTERLQALREAQRRAGAASLYDRACSHIAPAEAERRAAGGEAHVIRMRVPAGQSVLNDIVVGEVRFPHGVVDDQVLLKSDGFPTYHLAAVVDDHAMAISHVIRGQEWLSSTPKHMLLYAALGWTPPAFAHLPLLLNVDKSKLSKRHGDAAVEDFMVRRAYTVKGVFQQPAESQMLPHRLSLCRSLHRPPAICSPPATSPRRS
jgi:glutamyl-tRNA synthetase